MDYAGAVRCLSAMIGDRQNELEALTTILQIVQALDQRVAKLEQEAAAKSATPPVEG